MISYKLLGTREWFVIHHSDCGMQLFDDAVMGELLTSSLRTASYTPGGWQDPGGGGSTEGRYVRWLTFDSLEQSVIDDVDRIRQHPLVPGDIPIYGYYYDVRTGRLVEVPEASRLGRPQEQLRAG